MKSKEKLLLNESYTMNAALTLAAKQMKLILKWMRMMKVPIGKVSRIVLAQLPTASGSYYYDNLE